MTNHAQRAGLSLGIGLLLATAAAAQDDLMQSRAKGRLTALPRAIDDGAGLQWIDGRLIGVGRAYKAYFTAAGVEFVPALGMAAPRNMPLHLRGARVGRGGTLEPLEPVAPRSGELTVDYLRGSCIERYELRSEGMEQSFVFDRLPAGSGDLVVQCTCTTDLPQVEPVGSESVRFFAEGIGGITIGEVQGIDAEGRRAKGSARFADGKLELRLPEAFVSSAALPLVLDPIVSSRAVSSSLDPLGEPSVAYLPGTWMVVYERTFSNNDIDVYGRTIDEAAPHAVSNVLTIAGSGNHVEHSPSVGSIAHRTRFVVAYVRTSSGRSPGDILSQTLARTGAATSIVLQLSDLPTNDDPSVSGSSRPRWPEAVVVWDDDFRNRIRGLTVGVDSAGTTYTTPAVNLTQSSSRDYGSPSISKTGGALGNHVVAYTHADIAPFARGISAVFVDDSLSVLLRFFVMGPGNRNNDVPRVDGDGLRFVVAWHQWQSMGADRDLLAATLRFSPRNNFGIGFAPIPIETTAPDAVSASVGVVGSGCLVGWTERDSTADYGSIVASFDLDYFCNDCEGRFTVVDGAGRNDYAPQIAANYDSAGRPGDRALLAVARDGAPGFLGGIAGFFWEAEDGEQIDLGGECSGARTTADCALVGNPNFRIGVAAAQPSAPAFLVLSLDRLDLTCGTCTLFADPFSGWVLPISTGSDGSASLPMAIPAANGLRGAGLYCQWVQVGNNCQQFGLELSNGLLVRIE